MAQDTDLKPDDQDGAERTYDPSTVEVNRARQQGGGVGQTDLDRQRDPAGEAPAGPPEDEAP